MSMLKAALENQYRQNLEAEWNRKFKEWYDKQYGVGRAVNAVSPNPEAHDKNWHFGEPMGKDNPQFPGAIHGIYGVGPVGGDYAYQANKLQNALGGYGNPYAQLGSMKSKSSSVAGREMPQEKPQMQRGSPAMRYKPQYSFPQYQTLPHFPQYQTLPYYGQRPYNQPGSYQDFASQLLNPTGQQDRNDRSAGIMDRILGRKPGTTTPTKAYDYNRGGQGSQNYAGYMPRYQPPMQYIPTTYKVGVNGGGKKLHKRGGWVTPAVTTGPGFLPGQTGWAGMPPSQWPGYMPPGAGYGPPRPGWPGYGPPNQYGTPYGSMPIEQQLILEAARKQEEANAANEQRYLDILEGLTNTRESVLGNMDKYNQDAKDQTNLRYHMTKGDINADMAARGLMMNSTPDASKRFADTMNQMALNAIDSDTQKEINRLDMDTMDRLVQQMYNREDAYDPSQTLSLLEMYGQSGMGQGYGGQNPYSQNPYGQNPWPNQTRGPGAGYGNVRPASMPGLDAYYARMSPQRNTIRKQETSPNLRSLMTLGNTNGMPMGAISLGGYSTPAAAAGGLYSGFYGGGNTMQNYAAAQQAASPEKEPEKPKTEEEARAAGAAHFVALNNGGAYSRAYARQNRRDIRHGRVPNPYASGAWKG